MAQKQPPHFVLKNDLYDFVKSVLIFQDQYVFFINNDSFFIKLISIGLSFFKVFLKKHLPAQCKQ